MPTLGIRSQELGGPMTLENLLTVKQVAEASPAFSEASLRWLIFNSKENGFDSVIIRIGGRVLIDVSKIPAWVELHRLRQ